MLFGSGVLRNKLTKVWLHSLYMECGKEINSKTPGYEELKQKHDLLVKKYFAKNRSWNDEVMDLKKQLKNMQTQNKKTKDEELKNMQSQNEMKMKEREIMALKEQLKNMQTQNKEKMDEELMKIQSQNEKKVKEMERKYKEEKIKIAGLTRKVNALETEKEELKQDVDNATEFFNELDGMNDELKNTNERLSAQVEKDIRYIESIYRANSDLKIEI